MFNTAYGSVQSCKVPHPHTLEGEGASVPPMSCELPAPRASVCPFVSLTQGESHLPDPLTVKKEECPQAGLCSVLLSAWPELALIL